jgi:hypothetical protein
VLHLMDGMEVMELVCLRVIDVGLELAQETLVFQEVEAVGPSI